MPLVSPGSRQGACAFSWMVPVLVVCKSWCGRDGVAVEPRLVSPWYGHWGEVDMVSLAFIVSPMHSVRLGATVVLLGWWPALGV